MLTNDNGQWIKERNGHGRTQQGGMIRKLSRRYNEQFFCAISNTLGPTSCIASTAVNSFT